MICVPLSAERFGTFGSNLLKFQRGWQECGDTVNRNAFTLAPKSSSVKSKEFTMREVLHKRKEKDITYFKTYLRPGDK
jgi:hypothetical protein